MRSRGLHEQSAADRADLRTGTGRDRGRHEDPQVLLRREQLKGVGVVAGGDDHLGEHLGHLRGHRCGHRPVGRDDPAERRYRVAVSCARACALRDVVADGDAARVGVLDDRDGRLGEVVGSAVGGIGIDVVVVGHLLAVQLLGRGQPAGEVRRGVERRPWCGFSP